MPGISRGSDFPAIDGEMARRVRRYDWASTPLGPISGWPQSLKTAVGIVLLSPVPIVMLWGEDGIMIYNDAYSVFAGARHPQLLGSKVREGWPEVADFNDNVMKVGLAGGTLAYRDQELTLYRTGLPEQVWMNLDYSPILDESGKPAGVMAIVVETTARVQAERAQADANERVRLATENAEVGLWDIDRDGNISFHYAPRAFSMPQDRKTPAEEFFRHVHPDDLGTLMSAYHAARDAGTRTALDVEYRTLAMGNIPARWMAIKGKGVFDTQGNCVRISGTAVDITKRKEAEQALRRKEEQLRLATDGAGLGLWDVDYVTGINFAQPRLKEMFGLPPESGAQLEEYFALAHPDDADRVRAAFADAADPAKRAAYDEEYRVIGRDDGVTRWVAAKGRAIFDESGRCLRVLGTCMDVTARRQTEEALKLSEEQLRLATDHAEIGHWDVDNITNTLYWPARVKAMFGISSQAPVSMDDFYTGLHPDDREAVSAAFAAANDPEKRALYDVEYRTIGKEDGITRWVAAKGRGVFSDDGRCIRVIGTAIDITMRREIQDALMRSEEQLRLATEHADVGLWDVDIVNDIVWWPKRVMTMFGMAADRVVKLKDFRDRIHPDDKRRVIGAILAACDPDIRAPYDAEYRAIGENDGVARWLAVKGRALFDEQNRCVRMLGIILDITARKAIERQLQELNLTLEQRVVERTAALEQSEAKLRAIFETSHLYLGLMAADGTLLYANPTALAAVQADLAEVTDRPLWDGPWFTSTPGMSDAVKAAVARVAGGHAEDMTVTLQLPIGTRSFDFSMRPVKDDRGQVVAIVPEAVDITPRLKAEQALQQAQKMEAIGNLTGGIAHDFNNLLQGLSGSLDLIRRRPDDTDRVRRWAEAGLQSAERGAKLTAQLLAFSRAQRLEVQPVDLAHLLGEVRDLLQRTLGPLIRIAFDVDEHAGTVLGDETQLEMAILNLAINARDAMPGGGELIIGTRRRSITFDSELAPGEYVELTVSDSGSGMSADIVSRAFDPFFTTKSVGKGTGLGLSQVYGMARQAGGTARIRSTAEQGTTVSILLRLTDQQPPDGVAREAGETRHNGHAATVLVIDDDPGVRQFLSDSLESLGYAVLQAGDGKTGLAMLERTAPDMLILDYAMPGMTGAEVAQLARAMRGQLPIIFASGYAETSALENVLDGNTVILRKPFRISDLQDALDRVLKPGNS
jgi:PAS domain S-box-containing protein